MKLNWLNKIIFTVNVLIAVLLGLANFSAKATPIDLPYMYLLGLAYPLFLLLNITFVLYWIYQRKVHFILSTLLILTGTSNISTLIGLNTNESKTEKQEFSVMSFNVRLFNQFHWFESEDLDQQILDYIEQKSPDVIAFQEFINKNQSGLRFIDRVTALGYKYHKVEPRGVSNKRQNFFGLATFSKYKIVNSGAAFRYPKEEFGKTVCLYTDIKINKQIIRVYNTHLNSLKFRSEDYQFVENLTENNDSQALKKSKTIMSKVLVSAEKRENEVNHIVKNLDECSYPIILLGDFNEPPYSFSYHKLTANLSDAFLQYGFGLGTTFDGISTLPGLRLDFLLHSHQLTCDAFITGKKGLSDHRPLMAWFHLNESTDTETK